MKIPEHEIDISAVRGSGPGGQAVNKTSSAAHLRFDIHASSLSAAIKQRLLASGDSRITTEGVVVIKSNEHRSLPANIRAAKSRLENLIDDYAKPPKRRIPTRPSRAAKRRRLEAKARRGDLKKSRQKPDVK